MQFQENQVYHIYNRGNNKQVIFYSEDNYYFFSKKMEKYIAPYCDILCYCLMPNHFHVMIHANEKTVQTIRRGDKEKNVLSEGIKNLLSTYAQAINKQYGRTGSLFTQNTCSVCTSETGKDYSTACFHYIHQNPLKAALVEKIENWKHSSFGHYNKLGKNNMCNIVAACKLLDIDITSFYADSYNIIDNDAVFYIE